MSRDREERKKEVTFHKSSGRKEALEADAARCLEKTARSDISQYARVRRPAWALLLGRDWKGWALMGRDARGLSRVQVAPQGSLWAG